MLIIKFVMTEVPPDYAIDSDEDVKGGKIGNNSGAYPSPNLVAMLEPVSVDGMNSCLKTK